MKKLITHIIRLTLAFIPLVLTVANASAQIEVNQCDTMEFSVVSRPGIPQTHFVWAIYNSSDSPTDVLDPAGALDPAIHFVGGQYAGSSVLVTGLEVGKYYVRINVWDEISCTDNIEMYVMEVLDTELEAELFGDSLCIGDPAMVKIIFTGIGPYNITYTYGDGSNVVNLNGISEPEYYIPFTELPILTTTTQFWIMEVSNDCKVRSYESEPQKVGVVIFPKPSNSKIYLKE